MHKQVIPAITAVIFLFGCKAQEPLINEPFATETAIENTRCKEFADIAGNLKKAKQGDFESMTRVEYFYKLCDKNNNIKNRLYWLKNIIESEKSPYLDDGRKASNLYLGDMSELVLDQINPKNVNKDPDLILDPLLYWVWQTKDCAYTEEYKKIYPDTIVTECNANAPPDWIKPEQWQKIIVSAPTIKDKTWYQYLPKACERGECLPK
jgi:hypothetical protein